VTVKDKKDQRGNLIRITPSCRKGTKKRETPFEYSLLFNPETKEKKKERVKTTLLLRVEKRGEDRGSYPAFVHEERRPIANSKRKADKAKASLGEKPCKSRPPGGGKEDKPGIRSI